MTKSLRNLLAAALGVTGALTAAPAMADGIPDETLARFNDPLCPGVIGLPLDQAVTVVGRIRENAGRLGLRMAAEEGCRANLIVSFLDDGQDYLRRLDRERSYLFDYMDQAEKRALLDQTGPARAWLVTETRTRDGMRVGPRENLVQVPQASMWSAHSLIYQPTRQDIRVAMVLIDRAAVPGLTLAQLADYATLHGLADYVPAAADGVPSIQRLFAGAAVAAPQGLTEFDMAYLASLYSSIPNLPASARLGGLDGVAE